MKSKPCTIRDVARKAGVSESTVSRVLNGKDTAIAISAQTRKCVMAAAKDLGYRPHPGARVLRGNSTGLIGIIVREVNDPFFAELIDVITGQAQRRDYGIILGYAKNDPAQALTLTNVLDLRLCDGLLLLGDLSETEQRDDLPKQLSRHAKLVMVCRGSGALLGSLPSVGVDNHEGGRVVMSYLESLGHRRIGLISAGRAGDFHERLLAYEQYRIEQRDVIPQGYIQIDDNSHEGGYRAMLRELSLSQPPTAIWCADDTMAVGAMAAAKDRGYDVPGDISIVGFDDTKIAAYLRPALTTVRQPLGEIGRKAVELLLKVVSGAVIGENEGRLLVKPQLIVRNSCMPPKPDTGQ
ncbi:MAG: LacI family DNA-binding transcriptional regulator [Caldilineaceae bacterium]|nr:LacI family DNA-binding transcriptional regulator [Caldilineaceae bacterium]